MSDKKQNAVKTGITFGSALAMVISYTTWKSVGWAIFHGLFCWDRTVPAIRYLLYFTLLEYDLTCSKCRCYRIIHA